MRFVTESWEKQTERDMELDIKLEHLFGKLRLLISCIYLYPASFQKCSFQNHICYDKKRVKNEGRQIKMMLQAS